MDIRNQLTKVLWTTLLLFSLTGCWDNNDLEQRTAVVAIAIDRIHEHGKKFLLTVQIPIPRKIMGGASGKKGEEAIQVMSATGNTINEALMNIQKRVNQRLFYGHTRILVLSEEVAKEGIGNILDSFRRQPQIRRLMWPIVTKDAQQFLYVSPSIEQIPTVFIMDLMKNSANREEIPDTTLGEVFNDLSEHSVDGGINYIVANKTDIEWKGYALLKDDQMVGVLNAKEVYSLLQLRDGKIGGEIETPCPHSLAYGNKPSLFSFRPKSLKVDRQFRIKSSDLFELNYYIRLEGSLVETQCRTMLTKKAIDEYQLALSKELEKRANHLTQVLQNKYRVDALKIGMMARGYAPQWWDEKMWRDRFSKGKIRVHYDVMIRRTGMMTR